MISSQPKNNSQPFDSTKTITEILNLFFKPSGHCVGIAVRLSALLKYQVSGPSVVHLSHTVYI